MLCDKCHKNTASVHMTTFVNGQVKTMHLCTECASKKKTTAAAGPSMSDFISAFYDDSDAAALVCGKCGTTLGDFRKTGRLGCAACYDVFRSAIVPVLKGVHMNTQHTGKHPGERVEIAVKDADKKTANETKKQVLRRELKMAVSTENYEEAARLRDEIALLDKEDDDNA